MNISRAQRILNEFNWDYLPQETLENRYFKLIKSKSEEEYTRANTIRDQIIQRYPERKVYIRDQLIKLAKKSNDVVRKHVEDEFPLWY